MNYEIISGLVCDKLSGELLVSELLDCMELRSAGELESMASNLLRGTGWTAIKVDLPDSLSFFKSIRGRGFMKRSDMRMLCGTKGVSVEQMRGAYLERIYSAGWSGLEKRFSDLKCGRVFAKGDDENLVGGMFISLTAELDIDRAVLNRVLNRYADVDMIKEYAEKEGLLGLDEELLVEKLFIDRKKAGFIPWHSIPENVFVMTADAKKFLVDLELAVDGVVDSMSDMDFIGEQLDRLI